MESFFTALSKRQLMCLLTAVTFGGSEGKDAFDHLPEEEAELLKERAHRILQMPREKRIPLLVQEIKRLVTARRAQLWAMDPARLAKMLSQERGALVEVVLRGLPASLAESVRVRLPIDQVRLRREVKPEVLDVIRSGLEQALTRAQENRPLFKFSDILLLQSRELLTVCERMGARVLVRSVLGLPDEEREQFLADLPPEQKNVVVRTIEAFDGAPLSEESARELLQEAGFEQGAAHALRSAGTQRLARACLAQSPEFAARVVERHRGEFGQLLANHLREERRRGLPDGDAGRLDLVRELEQLERQGLIDRPLRLPPPPKRSPLGERLVAPAPPGNSRNGESQRREITQRERFRDHVAEDD